MQSTYSFLYSQRHLELLVVLKLKSLNQDFHSFTKILSCFGPLHQITELNNNRSIIFSSRDIQQHHLKFCFILMVPSMLTFIKHKILIRQENRISISINIKYHIIVLLYSIDLTNAMITLFLRYFLNLTPYKISRW